MAIEQIQRDDVRFDRMSRGQNARFVEKMNERANQIYLCDTTDDVARALEQIVHAGMRPTVRSGGHCYEDFVDNNPNGAIIDLSLLAGTAPEANGYKYRLGAGTTLGRTYRELHQRALLTIPGGTCSSVGAGGHITGGGYGLLSRLRGITPDWVSAVEIVTVNQQGKAQVIRANKNINADLLRACRGAGGGIFGVVTNFYFDELPPAPNQSIRGNVHFRWDGMTEERFVRILDLYSEYWETRGRDRDTWGLFTVLNLAHRSSGHLAMSVNYTTEDGTANDTGPLEEFLAVFEECKPVRELATKPALTEHYEPPSGEVNYCVTGHDVHKMNWIDTVREGLERYETKFRRKYKSAYMKQRFTSYEAKCLYKHLTRTVSGVDLSGNTILVDSFGGAVNRKELLEETSSPQRNSILKLQFIASWTDPLQDAAHLQWIRDLYEELYATSEAGTKYRGTPFWSECYEGCYINYPDVDMLQHDFWPDLYYGTKGLYPFLKETKRTYDPHNIFHHTMAVGS